MNIFFDFDRSNISIIDAAMFDILIAAKNELEAFLRPYNSQETEKGFILIRLFVKGKEDGLVFNFPDKETVRILNEATAYFDINSIVKKYSTTKLN